VASGGAGICALAKLAKLTKLTKLTKTNKTDLILLQASRGAGLSVRVSQGRRKVCVSE
jgi:hypothetical protein